MYYNINDILPYVKNYEFSEYFSTRDEEFLISSIECDDKFNFDWNDGASKLIIIPENTEYVIKIPFNANYDEWENEYYPFCQNYCEKECDLFKRISFEEYRFSQFFLPLTKVKEFKEWDIYIQPKCQAYNNIGEKERSRSYSKGSLMKVQSEKLRHYTTLPEDWLAAVTEVLKDVKTVKSFIRFLEDYDITQDLHQGNIGYYNGKPIILDYGGFDD